MPIRIEQLHLCFPEDREPMLPKMTSVWLMPAPVHEKIKDLLERPQQLQDSIREQKKQYSQSHPTQDHEKVTR